MTSVARETLTDGLISELVPLFVRNWEESGGYGELRLDINWDMYLEMEGSGILETFIARTSDRTVAGYLAYMIASGHPHSKTVRFGIQDALFVEQWARAGGTCVKLVVFAENYLKAAGVGLITQTAKPGSPFNDVLERMGYEHTDNTYLKRI